MKHYALRAPSGAELPLEEIKSLRAVRVYNPNDPDNLFQVDFVTIANVSLKDYTCSFDCLNIICAMIYSESAAEDKTTVTISFEALVNALMMAKVSKNTEDAISDEDMEEFFNRTDETVLH